MSNNPYQPPRADLSTHDSDQYDDSSLWSTNGRIGRLNLAAYSFGILSVLMVFFAIFFIILSASERGSLPTNIANILLIIIGGIGGIGFIIFALLSIILSVKRFHDFNASGWWYLLSFVPYIGGFVGIFLLVKGGDPDENRFGFPPAPPSSKAKWIVIGSLIIMIASLWMIGMFGDVD